MIQNQRMLDLLRVCRSDLFIEHELIDEVEFAWLAGLPSVATHARLKDYDKLRHDVDARIAAAVAAEREACALVATDVSAAPSAFVIRAAIRARGAS